QGLIAADRAKMDFFRFVTHEIKSPVSTAQSAVETALELGAARMAPAVEDMLSRAVGRLEHAGEMVRNLADFTRGGDLGAENMGEVDLNRLVARIAEDLQELASRRGITFELDLPRSPVTVVSSRSMLEKIIQNLASNAVRYNREGGQVRIALKTADGNLRLEVADQGIGVDPADQGRIFEEFYRTPAAQEMTNMGTGLGLPIVKKFVKQLGGKVLLASVPGKGSTFTVELPIQLSGGERAGEGPPPDSPSVSAEAGS
ncbi:HAMP domain-containing histidine kinase, partial [bacterium]|nr:HAMP domain-containing histidine kinase [bacterium]